MHRPLRQTVVVAAAMAAAVPTLAACGGSSDPGTTSAASSSSPTSGSSSTGGTTTIDITLKDGTVSPNGSRVEAELGEPIVLRIDADNAGELHVHSTPEQEIEFPAGASTRRLTVDQPGIVDVEDHALDQVVVQLQVS